MKKITLWVALVVLSMTGCSKTWSGMKQDTHEVVKGTKDVIHEATAPTNVPNSGQQAASFPEVKVPAQSTNVEQVKSLAPVKVTEETSTIVPMVPVV